MISKSISMAPVEQVGRTWSRTAPVKMEGVEPAGVSNEYTYAGGFDELVAFAQEYIGAHADRTLQVVATVRRDVGGMAQLTLSTQQYQDAATDDGDAGGDAGGTGDAGGDEAEEAEVSIEVSGSTEDILTHPRFAQVDWRGKAGIALQKLARGADPEEEFEFEGGLYKVGEQAANVDGWELVTKMSSYYVPHVVATITDDGEGEVPQMFQVSAPAELTAPAGYNWLAMGGGTQTVGGKRRRVRKYMLSGPGGWDAEVYGGRA